MKKRGIYCDLNLNVGRSYKAGDGVQDFDKIQWGKGLTLFDPRLIELQKEYAKNLLTHVNPYTKLEYRNEPAIAIVEILNENGIYLGYPRAHPLLRRRAHRALQPVAQQKLSRSSSQTLRRLTAAAEGARRSRVSKAPK